MIKVDYTYYYEIDKETGETNRVYRDNEYYIFINKTQRKWHCDVICPKYRGFPFSMRLSPALHDDMRWTEENILYNLLSYFSICFAFVYLFWLCKRKYYNNLINLYKWKE